MATFNLNNVTVGQMNNIGVPGADYSRHVVHVFMDAVVISGICFQSRPHEWRRTVSGVPEGAKLVGRGYDVVTDRFYFMFTHPSFAFVPEGCPIPTFNNVQFSAMREDAKTK